MDAVELLNEHRRLLKRFENGAVPPPDVAGHYAGITECSYCRAWGSYERFVEHKVDCIVLLAKALSQVKFDGEADRVAR